MKYYTETIPISLAEKLKEKGMPMTLWRIGNGTDYVEVIETRQEIFDESQTYEVGVRYSLPTYAQVFDWLIGKEVFIAIKATEKIHGIYCRYEASINYNYLMEEEFIETDSWNDAANAAIEKALTLI